MSDNNCLPEIGKEALKAIRVGVEEQHPICCMEQLGVGQRLINLLEGEGITTLDSLMQKRKEELLKFKNFGDKQLQTLFTALARYHMLE